MASDKSESSERRRVPWSICVWPTWVWLVSAGICGVSLYSGAVWCRAATLENSVLSASGRRVGERNQAQTGSALKADKSSQDQMQRVQEKVALAERMFRNFEVRLKVKTELGTASLRKEWLTEAPRNLRFRSLMDADREVHAIGQGELYRVDEKYTGHYGGGVRSGSRSLMACVGKETRFRFENQEPLSKTGAGESFQLWDGRKSNRFALGPHVLLWGLCQQGVTVPFSVYLGGNEGFIKYFPNESLENYLEGGEEYRVEYSGQEDVAGMKCEKFAIRKIFRKNAKEWESAVVWLATQRNYLPLEIQTFASGGFDNHPMAIGKTVEFREVAPGIWYPLRCESLSYRKGVHTGRPEMWRREEMTVEKVSLGTDFNNSVFDQVSVPPGTARVVAARSSGVILAEIRRKQREYDAAQAETRRLAELQQGGSKKRSGSENFRRGREMQYWIFAGILGVWLGGILWQFGMKKSVARKPERIHP